MKRKRKIFSKSSNTSKNTVNGSTSRITLYNTYMFNRRRFYTTRAIVLYTTIYRTKNFEMIKTRPKTIALRMYNTIHIHILFCVQCEHINSGTWLECVCACFAFQCLCKWYLQMTNRKWIWENSNQKHRNSSKPCTSFRLLAQHIFLSRRETEPRSHTTTISREQQPKKQRRRRIIRNFLCIIYSESEQ